MNKRNKGFTLIELLVVIAIISLLSSIVLASLNSARAKARDAKRFTDMDSVRTALELYALDHSGSYPYMWGWKGTTPGCYGNTTNDPNAAIPGLAPTYISSMPQDPKPILLQSYCYLYLSDGVDYKFLVYDTGEAGLIAPGAPHARFPSPSLSCPSPYSESSYAVYSSGGACW